MTAPTALGKRIVAYFVSVACAFALLPLAPCVQQAQALPALNVTFDASTGIATWKAYPGAAIYYYECCEKIEPADWSGHMFSFSVTDPEPSGDYSLNFKSELDNGVGEGLVQPAAVYAIRIWACDEGGGATLAEWTYDYHYQTTAIALENVSLDASSGKLTWTAPANAQYYWLKIKQSSVSVQLWSTTVNLKETIDGLVSGGQLEKPADNTYALSVIACNEAGIAIAHSAELTFTYTSSATTPDPLDVSFNSETGVATWTAEADSYWFGVDGSYYPLESKSADFKSLLDKLYTEGAIPQKSSYGIVVQAQDNLGKTIAEWENEFYYTPKIVDLGTGAPPLPTLVVAFSIHTGVAKWAALPGASTYWLYVDGKSSSQSTATSADFASIINTMYSSNSLPKKSSYTVGIKAVDSAGNPLAEWNTTFNYTPKIVDTSVMPDITGAPPLAVIFDKGSGKATWSEWPHTETYFVYIDGTSITADKSVDFRTTIDGMYLKGYLKKKSSYEIAVLAYSAGSEKLLAAWKTTYAYTPAPTLARANILKIDDQAYSGKKKKPNPRITIGMATLKKGTHYKVSYKNNKKMGKATVTIKGKGLVKGKVKKTFKIVPAAPKLSLVSTGKKSATIKWKHKTKSVTGYMIKYGYDHSMKGAKTKKFKGAKNKKLKLKSLKNDRTCFVWMRSYKTVKGKKYYSAWSVIWFAAL